MTTDKVAIQRLTALWALTESGLGGIMHAFRSPFTGLFVGGIAMLLITLICYHSSKPWSTLMKSLAIVLMVKLMVSPHSLISAYFAVSFQAVLGGLLYSIFRINLVSILILASLGMVESACQKVISLTVLYGKSLWQAVDELGTWVAKNFGFIFNMEASYLLIGIYVTAYFIAGLIMGLFIYSFVRRLGVDRDLGQFSITVEKSEESDERRVRKNRLRFLVAILLVAILIIAILFQSEAENNNWTHAFYIFGRTIIILILWYFVLAPILMKAINSYLSKRRDQLAAEFNEVFGLIPYMKSIVKRAWKESARFKGIKRFGRFNYLSLMYCLHFKISEKK